MAPLLSFKAGRATRRGETSWVDSQPERGVLTLEAEDGLLHLKHAGGSDGPLDLILFSGDAAVEKANGRVFVLKFSSSDDRTFFWFQDVSDAEDAKRLRRINALIDDVDAPEEAAGSGGDVEMSAGPAPAAPVASTSSSASAANAPAPAPAPTTGSASVGNQLADILAQFAAPQQQQQEVAPFTLNGILESGPTTAFIRSLPQSEVDQLMAFLPADVPHNRQTLIKVIASPEFKRAAAGFDSGLRTGGLAPVVASLGLPAEAAMGVDNYTAALTKQAGLKRGSDAAGSNMQVD